MAMLLGLLAIITLPGCSAVTRSTFEPLAPRLDSMRILLVRGTDEREIGMLWDETSLVRAGDGEYSLRRVYRSVNEVFGNQLDTMYSTVPGLRPLSHRVTAGLVAESIHYRSDSIVGWIELNGEPRRRIARVADTSLYDGHMFDMLIRRAPLRLDYQLSVPALLAYQDSVAILTATVTGSVAMEVEDGREVDTWVVEMDFAGLASTMWVEKSTRRLARQVIELAPGVSVVSDRLPRM